MHFVLDLHHSSDGVRGQVLRNGADGPEDFSGWLELFRLLEPRPATGPDPVQTVRRLVEAENRHDREAAERLLAADFVGITRARGEEQARDELLAEVARPANPDLDRDVDADDLWTGRGPNLCVVRSIVTTDEPVRRFRNLHVLVVEQDRWRCLAWQVTELKP
ncbi:nuclear transport factor 2 family protein [Nonomuraea sp. NPDC047897]|uniref:nuclear transport factor 2 family protein n=1 Tax=Nonomuraea sp. NPDC047897 TaxID=3364346 RepID=UPI0037155A6F